MSPATDRHAFRALLATLAAKTQAKIPALNGRVEKALRLALAGDVELHADGTATVYSSSDPTRRYAIIEGTCTCRDYEQAPQHLCQHRLSAGLVRRTQALLPQDPAPDAVGSTDTTPLPDVVVASNNNVLLPEAPASVNVRVMMAGREVQWTLRDHDEARLATRLEVLLARYPVVQPPAQASSQSEGWCSKHNCAMQEQHKDGRTWRSHRTAEGWCKGK
jgi:hypothetical protein